MRKRVLACLMTAVMLVSLFPLPALAAEPYTGGLCPHHPQHTEDCGYVEAVAGHDCGHVHDGDCGYVAAAEEIPCNMGCTDTDGDGLTDHAEGCAYTPAVEGQLCQHKHDGLCGYVAAVPGHDCGYVCQECLAGAQEPEPEPEPEPEQTALQRVQAMIGALPDGLDITPDNRAGVEAQLAAIDTARAELTDEELGQLDTARYQSAVSALAALDGQAGNDLPMPAADGDVSYQDRHWDETTKQVVTVEKTVSNPKAVANSDTTWTEGWYVVKSPGQVTISSRVTVSGDVHLILENGCDLQAERGICVEGNNSLTIYGQSDSEDMGALTATATDYFGAGIGGNFNGNGTITINGGKVTANGADQGAGIGGGLNGDGGNITINGGTVTANGGAQGAGIGGGESGAGGTITINGGEVEAKGGGDGAGIGGGSSGNGSSGIITISGGTVKANGGDQGAGIGGGKGGNGSSITISGTANVTANGGKDGAGIGGGRDGAGGTITIEGNANVTAKGGSDGAGIGGGYGKDGGTITISGGEVEATGGDYGAGIGEDVTLTNEGTITNNGTIIVKGTFTGSVTGKKLTPAPDIPTSLTATYGQTLADVTLPSDRWAWVNSGSSVGDAGSNQFPATYTPADTNYNAVTEDLPVTVNKAQAPAGISKALNIANHLAKTYTFAFSNLRPAITGEWGQVSYSFNDSNISFTQAGYYTGGATITNGPGGVPNTLSLPIQFNDVTTEGQVGTVTVTIHSQNYTDYTGTINIMASNKTAVTFSGVEGVTVPYTGQSVTGYTGTLVITDTRGNPVSLTPEISYTGRLSTSYESTQPPTDAGTYFVVFRAADTDEHYIGREHFAFEITRATPTGEPNYTAITAGGKTLADAALTTEGGTFSVPGTVAWELDETTTVEAGTAYKWIFTPTDTRNYNTLEGSVTLWQRSTGGGSTGGGSTGGGSSGGGSSTPTYRPDVSKPGEGGGTPAISPSNPKQGDTVTVTPRPDSGYEVDRITVTDRGGKNVEVTKKPDGTYTFTQPSGRVTIEIEYAPVPLTDLPWGNPFTDVSEGAWYCEAVQFVQERGLMGGYSDGRFGPNNTLSRAQLAQILFNKEGRPGVNYLLDFSDVADGAWCAEAIRWAASQGIVGGYGNGLFGPNDPITREQLAVMLWRYSGSPAATDRELHFTDTDKISDGALEAMRWAVENGIMDGYGDGRLDPRGQATRAQVAQMLKNFIEAQEEENT